MNEIFTSHLILRSLPPETIAILANSNPDQTDINLLEHRTAFEHDLTQFETDPAFQHWSTRIVLLRATGEMIGIFRFHTRPNPDYLQHYGPSLVEIGYAIFPPHRRKGFAAEMINGMIQWAKQQGATGIITSIAPDNIPSTNLVTKMGFVKIDEADGIEFIYLKKT